VVFYKDLLKKEYLKKASPIGKDKQRCCYWLKVVPLKDFIRKYRIQALFVAIRRDEHPERAKEKIFSPREDHTRIHPILHWKWLEVWEYIKKHNLPFNPLYLKGYSSLGCEPCTSVVKQDGFKNIDEIISFIKEGKVKERAGRDVDKELIMERLRKLGYF
ncbi:phosphoadenosine phosphosulfate reductase family protein, partial [bacterium]|nr:phosphoadenosine phosphosulfate reductase family protein [bacterium]